MITFLDVEMDGLFGGIGTGSFGLFDPPSKNFYISDPTETISSGMLEGQKSPFGEMLLIVNEDGTTLTNVDNPKIVFTKY